jgi:serine protease Do
MLDKKKLVVPIVIVITAAVVGIVGWEIKRQISAKTIAPSHSIPVVTTDRNSTNEPTETQSSTVENIARKVTVRVLTESAHGSGVTIGHTENTYTVLTCHHVIAESKKGIYKVLLSDGQIYPARVKSAPQLKGLDLALVEFETKNIYQVVKLGESEGLVPDSSVYAAGFPNHHVVNSEQIEDTSDWGLRAFKIASGKVGSISPQSLPEGYSLGYTSEVASGMSGGPVFNDKGELIGINGRLKYPVQGIDAFILADGTKPSVEMFQQMEALSWAIPIATYQQVVKK